MKSPWIGVLIVAAVPIGFWLSAALAPGLQGAWLIDVAILVAILVSLGLAANGDPLGWLTDERNRYNASPRTSARLNARTIGTSIAPQCSLSTGGLGSGSPIVSEERIRPFRACVMTSAPPVRRARSLAACSAAACVSCRGMLDRELPARTPPQPLGFWVTWICFGGVPFAVNFLPPT